MNINERKKTALLLNEWKNFLNEENKSNSKKKIETVQDLKEILDTISEEDLDVKNKSDKNKTVAKKIFSVLLDVGADVSGVVVPGASLAKNIFGLISTIAKKTPDSERGKLSSLGGMDLPEDIDKIFTASSITSFLKNRTKELMKEPNKLLSDINFKQELIEWAKEKIESSER